MTEYYNPPGNPYESPQAIEPPAIATPSAGKTRIGDYINLGFTTYGATWKDWIVPVSLCGLLFLVSYLACVFPLFLVAGPLSCGLHHCGLLALRGQAVDTGGLRRGWELWGSSVAANVSMMMLQALPIMLIVGVVCVVAFVAAPFLFPGGQAGQGGPADGEAFGAALFGVGMVLYIAAIFGNLVWTLWISTRLMFVMPLIADQGVDFRTAISMSWAETRKGFWELLALHFLASLLSMLGMYACYLGIIFTLPLYYLIVGAAYQDRFNRGARSPFAPVPPPQLNPQPLPL